MTGLPVDVVYVATSAHDGRFTRICIASIRAVYPEVPIRLLLGGPVETSRLRELAEVWDARPAEHVPPGNYGWGFVKLEPLFGPPGERFLVLDSDTVFLGPALDAVDPVADFTVDDELQGEADMRHLYFDWEVLQAVDPRAVRPAFVFNSGQWAGSAGVLTRDDFSPWVLAGRPPRLRHPSGFMGGEQGVLNYVLNQKVQQSLVEVARRPLMRWLGHDTADVALAEVVQGATSPHRLVAHWAGFKAAHLGGLPRTDLLRHFERVHYEAQGGGERLRRMRALRDAAQFEARRLATPARLWLRRRRALTLAEATP